MTARRVYHYHVNLHGQLFLHGQRQALRDSHFLDFFFSRIEPVPNPEGAFKWLSKCGREYNYISADDTPIVFRTWADASKSALMYAGSLSEPFSPAQLRISSSTLRLLYLPIQPPACRLGPALLHPNLAQELSSRIIQSEDGGQFLFVNAPIGFVT